MQVEEQLVIRKKGKKLLPKYINTRPLEDRLRKYNAQRFAPDLAAMLLRREKKQANEKPKKMPPVVQQQEQKAPEVFDLWGCPIQAETQAHLQPPVKALVLPKSGQSYNPSTQDYETFANSIVEKQVLKNRVMRKEKIIRSLRKKIVKAKNKKKRAEQLQARRRKELAQRAREMADFPTLVKEAQNKQRKAESKRIANEQAASHARKQAEQEGIVEKGPKIGKRRYESGGEDILAIEQMPSSLRVMPNRESVALDRFQSLSRRGMFEVLDAGAKKQKAKFRKFKVVQKL